MVSSCSFRKVVMAATSGILQMNQTDGIDFWGDESVLDLSIHMFVTGESKDLSSLC